MRFCHTGRLACYANVTHLWVSWNPGPDVPIGQGMPRIWTEGKVTMTSHRRLLHLLGLVFLVVALIPATVFAQQAMDDDDDSFILQVNRPVTVASGDMVDVVVVIDDDAVIDGQVTDTLVVVNGTATVNGFVTGDVIVAEGALVVNDGATVNDVTLFRSDMTENGTATVTGDVTEQDNYAAWGWGMTIFSVVFWIGTTIAILLAGLAIMALFGRQMDVAAQVISTRPLESVVSGLVTWILLPILAILTLVTIIGIPVGLGLLFVVIPLMALLGYMAAAYWLGLRIVAMANFGAGRYLSLVIGLVVLALVGAIPWFGGVITFFATLFGTGAFVWYIYRLRREPRPVPAPPAAPAAGGPAHA